MSSNPAIKKMLAVTPAILMLLGVILIVSGVGNAMYSIETHPSDTQTVVVYPKLLVGSAISLIGVSVSIFSYLILHNKIGVARYFKEN